MRAQTGGFSLASRHKIIDTRRLATGVDMPILASRYRVILTKMSLPA